MSPRAPNARGRLGGTAAPRRPAAPGAARLVGVATVLLSVVLVLGACLPARSEVTGLLPSGRVAPVVKVGSGGALFDAALYLAHARGYFIEQGLTVEIVELPGVASVLPPLVAGQIDFGAVMPNLELLDALRGPHGAPRIVASAARALPGQSLVVLLLAPGVPAPRAEHLRGRRLATEVYGAGARIAAVALADLGLTLDDLTVVDIPLSDAASALRAGDVEVAVALEPEASRVVAEGGARRWLGVDALDPDQDLALLAASPNVVQNRPAIGQRWLTGYLRGQREFMAAAGDEAARQTVWAVVAPPLRLGDAARARALQAVAYALDGAPDLPSLQALERYFQAAELLKGSVDWGAVVGGR